ncbi:MAG: peptidoglycan DD-metalloendopeptidase family protein [Sphingobacteriaceae bacterium]|nr:peptidoglycan DD-metalloendopeptidase family protein [Sphingobacteriaceae bacterium]
MGIKTLSIFLLFLSLSAISYGQSSAELKRRKASLTREIEALKKEQNKIAGNKRLSLRQIDALSAQIRLREEKISTINSEVRLLSSQIREKTNTVQSLQEQLAQLKKEYAAMVRFAFRNQNSYGKLMFVFASSSFNQAYKRLKYFQQFSEHRKKQALSIRNTQKELGMKIVELDEDKRSKSNLLHSQEVEKSTLSKEKTDQALKVSKLSKQEQLVKKQVDSKKKEVSRLNNAITTAIRKEIEAERKRAAAAAARAAAAKAAAAKAAAAKAAAARAAAGVKSAEKPVSKSVPVEKSASKSTNVLSSTPATAKLSSGFLNNRGRLPWPVQGTIVSRFGAGKYKEVRVQNNGVDIKTAVGSSVSAIFSGEVRLVRPDMSGYIVLLRHGEYFSVYANLRNVSVSEGQTVSAGQNIGSVRTNSDDGTTQLHLEIWKGTSPTNPEIWLNR